MPAVIAAPQERAKGTMRLDKGREREGQCRVMVCAHACVCVRVCWDLLPRIEIVFLAGPNVLFTEC